jgi:enamine deaminase RidA (YjgF/YER057c/UK114 family)
VNRTAVEVYATPGYGERMLANRRYSQPVRIGDRVETSGQGGWDDDDQLRKRMPDRAPIWTQTGVTVLGAPKMRVEIRVTAVVGAHG